MTAPGSAHPSIDPSPETAASPQVRRRFDARRLYTAAILIPAIYVVIRYLPPWALTSLVMIGGAVALFELYRLAFGERFHRWTVWCGIVMAVALIGRTHLAVPLADLMVAATLAMALGMLSPSVSLEARLRTASIGLFGALYVGLTLSTLVLTRAWPSGELFVLFLAIVTWAGDTGAYYSGSLWGRHRLAPAISPKKTLEGLVGGIVLAVAAALMAQAWLLSAWRWPDALALGVLLTTAGLLGDLCESAIKRSVNAKDSGGILPGHGGMLDRLDSLLFTAPTFYYYGVLVHGLSPIP